MRRYACLICFVVLTGTGSASAQLTSLETKYLRLVYLDPTYEYIAPYTARCFENSLGFQREVFEYEPWEKVTVLLLDLSDYGNAGAGATPRNSVSIQIAPSSLAYETMTSNERINATLNHELVHVAALDGAARSDRFFRKLFRGKVKETSDHPETILYGYLTVPRMSAPRWYHEGIATFLETWMSGGIGRAQGSYDETVFRSKVLDDSPFYDPLGLVAEGTRVDFQVGANSYLYGTRFMSYLAHEHSPEKLIEWVARKDGTDAYYAHQFRKVYGMPLDRAWSQWVAWEKEFQLQNLETIWEYPTTPYVDLSSRALGSMSRPYFDPETRTIYAAFNYPGVVAHIGAISVDDGSVRRIRDVKDPMLYIVTSLAYDPESRLLFYTTDNNAHRDLRSLDPATGKSRRLLKDARIGDIAFSRADRALWGIRHLNGIATLVKIPYPYAEWTQTHSWPYGTFIYDLDISPDGSLVSVSHSEIDGNQSLQVYRTDELALDETAPIARMDFGSTVPSNFVFSADGGQLYGSTYYTGVSNIFRYDIASGDFEALTNTETGMFRPIPLEDDALIVFRYTGDGFVPARIEERTLEDVNAITLLGERIAAEHPVVKTWKVGSPAEIELEPLIERQAEYQSVRGIAPESIYPVIEGYKDFTAYGFVVNFSDPLRMNNIHLTTSYSPEDSAPSHERLHIDARYERYNFEAFYKYNGADFYDLFGPTKRSRKGYSLGVDYTKTLIYDLPRRLELEVGVAKYGNMDRLPRYQNVDVTFDSLIDGSLGLKYEDLRSSLGAVDHEKGIETALYFGASRVDGDTIPLVLANLDVGFPLFFGHSSLWLRSWGGQAYGEVDDPFANFFFGGFGNNRVDRGSIKRYREYYAFPGFELNEIGGQNFVKSMVEWNLPPIRFRKTGTPGLHLAWARTSLFAGGLRTNLDESDIDRTLGNYGAQIDFRFTALSRLPMTFSLGYAVGFEKDGESEGEFMFSLKIL